MKFMDVSAGGYEWMDSSQRGPNTTLTLSEQISESIAAAIISGEYPSASQFREQELAEKFGVSRGPIRDALRALENEGLVEIQPRRGTVVRRLSPEELEEIYLIRSSLMGLAGHLAAQRLSPENAAALKTTLLEAEKVKASEDPDRFLRFAYRMSALLAQVSGSRQLQGMIRVLSRQTLSLSRIAFIESKRKETWVKNWREVVSAVLRKDVVKAETAARHMVLSTGSWAKKVAQSSMK